MKKSRLIIILTLAVTAMFFSGCKSLFTQEGRYYSDAKSAIRRSAYAQGIHSLSMALQLDPEYRKALLLLTEAYPAGIDLYEKEARKYSGGLDLDSLDRTAGAYRALVSIRDSIGMLPALVHPKTGIPLYFSPPDYREQMKQAELNAAEGHYQEGIRLSMNDDRESAKQSSREFLKAMDYVPDYRDARQREAAVRQQATQRLALLPFTVTLGVNYGVDIPHIIPDNVIDGIINDPQVMEYTVIVDREQVEQVIRNQRLSLSGMYDESTGVEIGKLMNANLILAGSVGNITFDKPTLNFREDTREAVVPATEADLGRPPTEGETILVTAIVTTYRAWSSARMVTSFKLIDIETGTLALSNAFIQETADERIWAEYSGDARALTDADRQHVDEGRRSVKKVPELLAELSVSTGRLIADRLRGYLK